MKWTTIAREGNHHSVGFTQSERHSVPCNRFCKTFVKGGTKYITHYEESGCVIDPLPSTARGRRRGKKG